MLFERGSEVPQQETQRERKNVRHQDGGLEGMPRTRAVTHSRSHSWKVAESENKMPFRKL